MQNLRIALKNKLSNARGIALLGIGSELRGDDIAGILVAESIKKLSLKSRKKHPLIKVFIGSTAPENLTGEIKRFKPSHIIIVDAAELGKNPGTVRMLSYEEIGGISFSTHRLPNKVIVDYLLGSLNCQVVVLGIQPKSIAFREAVSKEVKSSAVKLTAAIKSALNL